MMVTYHIHLKGIVQGVGFRPAVYRFALQRNLKGFVGNTPDGLHMEFNCKSGEGPVILKELIAAAPRLSQIRDYQLEEVDFKAYDSFEIRESYREYAADLSLPPDYGLCERCRKELNDPTNRRYQYPFITCTECGPRLSILRSLPFDRNHTSMAPFGMCPDCRAEYEDPHDRRYYSQTNSCEKCGVRLRVFDNHQNEIASGNAASLSVIKEQLQGGRIVAVKGIGGFLLLCDAGSSKTIRLLRKRKHRPTKPFAVMCRDLDQIRTLVRSDGASENLLLSPEAPIVLLSALGSADPYISMVDIAPKLDTLGVMLPYAPLLEMILQNFGRPLIATSANPSGAPVLFKNEEALEKLSSIADYIVIHNRDIVTPEDDSVISITPISRTRIVIRRARGLAPSLPDHQVPVSRTIVATGALMKSAFTLVHKGNLYTSQYLGNTDNYDVEQIFKETLEDYLRITGATPDLILTDLHPDYFSTVFGKKMATSRHLPVLQVQHHKAHFAAVLAEHALLDTPQKILGVIWDGTGLGTDHQMWGGTFLVYEEKRMERNCHFQYFPVLLGDKMAREPRLSALSLVHGNPEALRMLEGKFNSNEWKLYRGLLEQTPSVLTDSCGRLFDAMASLLGICDIQSYEGEAAMLLESRARAYVSIHGDALMESYFSFHSFPSSIPLEELISGIVGDLISGKDPGYMAAKFHFSLVHLIKTLATRLQAAGIAFSGGVFQNGLLVDLFKIHLKDQFALYYHRDLSPNDENISFGQVAYFTGDIDHIQTQWVASEGKDQKLVTREEAFGLEN